MQLRKIWPRPSGLALAMTGLLAVAGLSVAVLAQAPAWWTNRNVLVIGAPPNDYAAVNQGQVKWLATQAAVELDEDLQFIGGAGSNVAALLATFSPTNNDLPVNLGQLKHTAQPFYDRLAGLGLTNLHPVGGGWPYPWSNATKAPADYALANIGEAKWLFSFDTATDTDGDGIPDIWEVNIGSNPYLSDAAAVNTNPWAQGQTNRDLYGSLRNLTIPNAWAVYTNGTQVAVVADIRSLNRNLTVKAAEFFMDSTNGVVFGAGIAMQALDGAFNSTNETGIAVFTPSFPTGERHVFFIHAQGSDNRWCPFVAAILNPNIDDVLNKIQANYSAIHDLQFTMVFTETKNNVVTRSDIVVVRMKGPYKTRSEYSTGLCIIQNENTEGWSMPSMGNGAMQSGFNGNFDPSANRNADIFWDVPLWRTRMTSSIAGNPMPGTYNVTMTPAAGTIWQPQSMAVDFSHGFVSQLSINDTGISAVINYSNPMEVLPGVWLFTSHSHLLQCSNGFQIITESMLTDIKVNQGLNDSLFAIPTE